MSVPKCPRCGTNKQVRPNGQLFYCSRCGCLLDGRDDGTVTYGDPARIAERNERHRAAEKYRQAEERRRNLKGGLGRS